MTSHKLLEQLIYELVEAEYQTKSGDPVSFNIQDTSSDPGDQLNKGWVVHNLKALVNGEHVGTIKISYIPSERFAAEYPNILSYIDKIQGRNLALPRYADLPKGKRASDFFETLSPAEQLFVLKSLNSRIPLEPHSLEAIKAEPPAAIEIQVKKIMKQLEMFHGEEYRNFKDFHIDKPLVDYITVKPSSRRNRIGAALYQKAAEWLATKGLKLYASGIQSDEAMASWEWLKQNRGANIGTETSLYGKTRTFLSYL